MISTVDLTVLSTLSVSALILWRRNQQPASNLPLPPGPKGLPLVGNMFDLPKEDQWKAYKAMSDKYNSGVIHMNTPGISILVVNTTKAAQDLLQGRQAIYSGRYKNPMMTGILGWGWNLFLMPFDEPWRKGRNLFLHEIQPPKLNKWIKPIITDTTTLFLNKLVESPERFIDHIRFFAGRIILTSAYGIDVRSEDDDILKHSMHANIAFSIAGIPGTYLIDHFPFLKYVPSWFPGANFRELEAEYADNIKRLPEIPMKHVREAMAEGTAASSISSRYIQELHDEGKWSPEAEKVLADTLGVMYAAGSDTSTTVLGTAILGIVKNPYILKKAQEAVDAVVGTDRLPNYSDERNIPYVTAVMKEALRWNPVTPLSIPHSLTANDVYEGMYMPKDSVVLGNTWAILHDREVYGEDVDDFRPERFLNADGSLNTEVPDPDVAFGYGRRVCAGKPVAMTSMWLVLACMFATFDITKAVTEDGEEIDPSEAYTPGLLSTKLPFLCSIKPRSEAAEALIKAGVEEIGGN